GGTHSLRNRMGATPAANNLRAKTGTISNVSSLSGYVRAANGELLAFSILVNDVPSTYQAKRMEDAVGSRLARFTRPDAPIEETSISDAAAEVEAELDTIATEPGTAADPQPEQPSDPPPAAAARTHRVRSGQTLDG